MLQHLFFHAPLEESSWLVLPESHLDIPTPVTERGRRREFSQEVQANSFDEHGAKPRRSRLGSIVDLGVGSRNASTSDLISRDSCDTPHFLSLRRSQPGVNVEHLCATCHAACGPLDARLPRSVGSGELIQLLPDKSHHRLIAISTLKPMTYVDALRLPLTVYTLLMRS